jgi:hypothetical protein
MDRGHLAAGRPSNNREFNMDDADLKAGYNMTPADALQYEINQNRNPINSWLHSFRYRRILDIFDSLAIDRPINVIELGSAHGKLFGLLNSRYRINYTGIEIDQTLAQISVSRFGDSANFRAIEGSATRILPTLSSADVVIALETMEHIKESDVVRIVEMVAEMRPRLFVCSVPVEIGPAIWIKNVGSWLTGYSRHLEYTWAETFWAGLYNMDRLRRHNGGHLGFDWRWLAQTIRHNMRIREISRFPFPFVAAGMSTSVFIVAEPYAST